MDWTFSIGNIVSMAGLLIVFFTAHVTNVRRLERMETKMNLIYGWFVRHVVKSDDGDSKA